MLAIIHSERNPEPLGHLILAAPRVTLYFSMSFAEYIPNPSLNAAVSFSDKLPTTLCCKAMAVAGPWLMLTQLLVLLGLTRQHDNELVVSGGMVFFNSLDTLGSLAAGYHFVRL